MYRDGCEKPFSDDSGIKEYCGRTFGAEGKDSGKAGRTVWVCQGQDAAPQNGNRTKERRTPRFVIEGVPGFRTRDLEKNVAAAFGYIFLFFAPFASMGDYTSSIQIFLLALSARIIFLWVATLVLINFGDWDMKIFLTRRFSKKARKGIRITLWIIIAYACTMLNDYVNYNLLGMIEP